MDGDLEGTDERGLEEGRLVDGENEGDPLGCDVLGLREGIEELGECDGVETDGECVGVLEGDRVGLIDGTLV